MDNQPRPPQSDAPPAHNGLRGAFTLMVGFIIVFFVLKLLGTLGWQWFSSSTIMPLRHLTFSRPLHYGNPEEIKRKVASAPSAHNLMFVDLKQVALEIKTIPWVRSVRVQRQWPDALLLDIEERQPLYRWNHHDLLDADGKRFNYGEREEFQQLFNLEAPEGSEEKMAKVASKVLPWLKARQLQPSLLRMDEYHSWEVVIDGVRFILGNDRELHRRLKLMVLIFRRYIEPIKATVVRVDLRYPSSSNKRHNFAVAKQSVAPEPSLLPNKNKKPEAVKQ